VKIRYRPEIDGLRAIAVVSVILYHAQITILGYQPFDGGFIGVDIFFVISGYLITSIILKEFVITGSFSLKYFYERRIRRILPVLLVVILASLPFVWMSLTPGSLVNFSKSILYSLGFISNFYFWYSGQDYAGENGLHKPFLHTWSLSVEEQFYILFPIVMVIVFKYFRKYLVHILILGFVVSLGLGDWGSRNYPSFTFYVLPTRGWELLAGSILAYFEITSGHRSEHKTFNLILPLVGIILIGYSILFFNDRMLHPSFYTLSPIIGVCLIIWFSGGRGSSDLVTKILSTKLFVGIGLISYSLYLWHYPIFSFDKINEFTQDNIFAKLLLILVIIILSIISYYFIERPARNKVNKYKNIFLLIISIYLFIFSLIIFLFTNKSLIFDKKLIEFNELENTRNFWEKCSIVKIKDNNICKIGNYDNKVFLIGDSHMIPLIRDLGEKLNKKNYQLNILTAPGFIYRRKLIDDKRVNLLKNEKNSIFIFGGYYQREDKNELKLIYKYYEQDFKLFVRNNHIIFLTPVPEVNFEPDIDLHLIKLNKKKDISINKKDTINRNKHVIDFISRFKDISVIDLNNVFCDQQKCYAVNPNKVILKSDFDHPSLKGAEMINELIINEIEKIQKKSN
jgi:peptidoglycan/LPS O-acetylase OafA/YrhL